MTDRDRTAVVLSYRKNRHNYRLLFGRPETEIRRGWHRKLAVFMPGNVFGYERWDANKYGTQRWLISVCRTASSGSLTQIEGVMPAAKLLLNVQGKTKSKRLLSILDELKLKHISLETIADRQWREFHNALEAGEKIGIVGHIFAPYTSC